ncbi:MAG: right-handed parallel beta-helix repeat-containing protein [Candidatus Cloacimonadaceae bacterium]|nr:right-handed parallel beta-helix repeat-containing protein [Candidatus Cloacimonadaceae bacterium]MDP3113418.1 right-handed parallel beta-helix repeat-containing protein [Candidatus Cloacimonadaceae bacterium]
MKAFLIACLFSLALGAFAIEVSGSQSGIWDPQNNPYQVIGDITVPSGGSLIIQPGVIVQLMGIYRITAQGTIAAVGTPADSIRFISGMADPNTLWNSIRLENTTQQSSFAYCYIEKAEYGINSINSPALIQYSRFSLNRKGLQLYGIGSANPAQVTIHHCIIERSIENGILVTQNSNSLILQNEIRFNGTGTQYRGAIQLANQSAGGSCSPEITDNHIHHNFKQGITAWDITGTNAIQPLIQANLIEYNLTGIYLLNASGYVDNNVIRHNFITGDMNSGAGVMVSGATTQPYFEDNDIYGNYTGFYVTNNAMPVLGDLSIYHAWAQGGNRIFDNIDAVGDLHTVFCAAYPNSANVIKAENNYWGTNDPIQVAAGINDHADSPALPTVDFDPWLSITPPAQISGSYLYLGQHVLQNPQLQLINVSEGYIMDVLPLSEGEPFQFQTDYQGQFYAVITATTVANGSSVYGIAGGFDQPTVFIAEPGAVINIGQIQFDDAQPHRYERVGTPVFEDGRMLYPVMKGFFVYHFDSVNWLYQQGDYLYLKKHERLLGAETFVFNLPPGTIWNKISNLNHADSWTRTEIIDHTGMQQLTQIDYHQLVDCHQGARTWYVQKDYQDNIISQTMTSLNLQLLFTHAPSGFLHRKEEITGPVADFILEAGLSWRYTPVFAPQGPSYLSYDPTYELLNPRIVTFFWQAPALDEWGNTWTHYRVYLNYAVYAEIPFSQCSIYLDELDLHTFYVIHVTATDGENESYPSNSIFLTPVSNDDNVQKPRQLSVYPNPFSPTRSEGLSIDLKNAPAGRIELSIHNQRGQLVKSHQAEHGGDLQYRWNGKDTGGKTCASGIYFIRIKSPGEKDILKKVLLLK